VVSVLSFALFPSRATRAMAGDVAPSFTPFAHLVVVGTSTEASRYNATSLSDCSVGLRLNKSGSQAIWSFDIRGEVRETVTCGLTQTNPPSLTRANPCGSRTTYT
jgi:hypothetical protein